MQIFQTPDFDEHCEKRDKAESAQLVLQKVDIEEHADWIVIIAFYQVLHLVDAYLLSKGQSQPTSHKARNNVVRNDKFLRSIFGHFDYMYNASIHARYDSWDDYSSEVQEILETDLYAIISRISPLI
jgi:hypothetical protein